MALTKERKGELAWIFLKEKVGKQGIRLSPNEFKREIGNEAKKMGVDVEEAVDFIELFVRELVDEMFPKRS